MNKFIALQYHSIGDYSDNEYDIDFNTFKSQMDYLSDCGFIIEGFKTFSHRLGSDKLPEKYALLTFDDGYKSFLKAGEYLNKIGFDCTFFLTKDWCKEKSNFLDDQEIKELSLISEIGSHTISHPYLTKIPSQKIKHELLDSKKWIEDLIDKDVISLGAPYGFINEKIVKIAVDLGYKLIGNSVEWWNNTEDICSSNLINRVAIRKSFSFKTFKKIIDKEISYFFFRKSRDYLLSIPKSILDEKHYDKIHKFLK
jgi:peptidoglycan/xylan/chitin deacetylase (PgdA/CDA1 family)